MYHVFANQPIELSRDCLVAAAITSSALLTVYNYRDQSPQSLAFYLPKLVDVFTAILLLGLHWVLRTSHYKEPRSGISNRADPLRAGVLSTCAMVIYKMLVQGQGFPSYFFIYEGEMWFWMGYWTEWWTAALGDILLGCSC